MLSLYEFQFGLQMRPNAPSFLGKEFGANLRKAECASFAALCRCGTYANSLTASDKCIDAEVDKKALQFGMLPKSS
jgi:hypothetical protein